MLKPDERDSNSKSFLSRLPLGHIREGTSFELPDFGKEDPFRVGDFGLLLQTEVHLELVPLLLQHDERHLRRRVDRGERDGA